MKKYLFAYAVLATALLFFTCRHYRAENRRLVENQTALAADVYFATKGETPSTTAKLTLVIDQDILFSDGDHGYISPHKNNPGIWDETRDYFYPIPTDDRSLTGGALTQNPGWNDGLNF